MDQLSSPLCSFGFLAKYSQSLLKAGEDNAPEGYIGELVARVCKGIAGKSVIYADSI